MAANQKSRVLGRREFIVGASAASITMVKSQVVNSSERMEPDLQGLKS